MEATNRSKKKNEKIKNIAQRNLDTGSPCRPIERGECDSYCRMLSVLACASLSTKRRVSLISAHSLNIPVLIFWCRFLLVVHKH